MAVDPKKLMALVERDSTKKMPPMKGKAPPAGFGGNKAEADEGEEYDEEDDDDGPSEEDLKLAEKVGREVKGGKTDKEVMSVIADYDPDVDGNPAEWVADEQLWDRAKAAVEPKWGDYDEPYAVVAHVYKQLGGAFNK